MGSDDEEYDQQAAIADVVTRQAWSPSEVSMVLTGAWVDDDGGGCVHSVRETLEARGFLTRIESAMDLDFDDGHDDDFDDDVEIDVAPDEASPSRPRLR